MKGMGMKSGKGLEMGFSRTLHVSRNMTTAGLAALVMLVAGCGDEEKSEGSFGEIAKAIDKPTGELSKENAKDIALAFERASSSSASGAPVAATKRLQQAGSQSQSQPCPQGGKINVSASQSGDSAHVTYSYDHCCYSSASCCMDGGGEYYYATNGASVYSLCISMSLEYECGEVLSGGASYSACMGGDGWAYSVEIKGKTFAVTGTLRNGTGTLTVIDVNKEWTCTYSNYEGSCTSGSATVSF